MTRRSLGYAYVNYNDALDTSAGECETYMQGATTWWLHGGVCVRGAASRYIVHTHTDTLKIHSAHTHTHTRTHTRTRTHTDRGVCWHEWGTGAAARNITKNFSGVKNTPSFCQPAADNARQKLNYYVLNGKPIRIMWAHKDPSFRKSGVGNIFIKVRVCR